MRFLRLAAIALLAPLGLYLAAAAILGHVPANRDWRQPDTGITIFVQTNGLHTGIVLPAGPHRWRAYGWGEREFYLNTPRWQDIRPGRVIAALAGSDATLVHVDDLDDFVADENWRPLRIRPGEYQRLHAFIAATFADHPTVMPGYGPRDRFYTGRGRYSAFSTCNGWTGNALRHAGVRTGLWTPFESDVMRWVPKP
jgi:hypothetical protein